MITSIIPKFLLEKEDIIHLKDKGIQFQEGFQTIGKTKIPCYKFFNLSETDVFDELYIPLNEATNDAVKISYANRVASILFLRIRQVAALTDKNQKLVASCSLLSAVNSLASLNISYAQRFLPLLRGLA